MRHWVTRKRIALLGVAAVVLLWAIAFVAPPAHEVHTPGATALNVSLVYSDVRLFGTPIQPSQSLSNIRCQMWRSLNGTAPCPDNGAGMYFPALTETPNVLYLPWRGCSNWGDSQGYNVEYLTTARKLIIHCYASEPWIVVSHPANGVFAIPTVNLLVVPSGSMGPGVVQIDEDDRIERLVGDLSDEILVATATIS
jgi:hypothetical protein